MIELARKANIPVQMRRVSRREVRNADELWIMSSTKEVCPIVMLDGKPIGDGSPGALFKQMYQLFQAYKKA